MSQETKTPLPGEARRRMVVGRSALLALLAALKSGAEVWPPPATA